MTGALQIIQADRAGWQRQAAAELAADPGRAPGASGHRLDGRPCRVRPGRAGERPGSGRAGPGRVRCLAGGAGAGGTPRAPARQRGDLAARGGPPRSGEGPADRDRLRRRGGGPVSRPRPVRPMSRHPACWQKLMASVRPEFRANVLVFDPADPVFGRGVCLVDGCGWHVHGSGMCQGHLRRWHAAGRPDPARLPAAMTAPWNGHGPLPSGRCRVAGCGFGVSERGLCARHASGWKRAGRPDPGPWAAGEPGRGDAGPAARMPDQLLRRVGSAGIGAVPGPRQTLERSWPARPGGVRPVLRGAPPGTRRRASRPGIAAPAAEAGTAVRPPAAAG